MKRTRLTTSLMAFLTACATNEVAITEQAIEERPSSTPRLSIRDHQGGERDLVLQSQAIGDAAEAQAGKRVRSRENVDRIYRDLYAVLAGTKFERELRLPHPDRIGDRDAEYVRGLVRTIVLKAEAIRGYLFPDQIVDKPLPPASALVENKPCVGGYPADVGSDTYGDLQSAPLLTSCAPSADGIIANDKRAYREHLSCVKDQANRGTCTAFAIASAMEMQHSMMFGTKVDLSEQLVYLNAFGVGYSTDGAVTSLTVHDIAQYPSQRKVPYESVWNYNPSWHRTKSGTEWIDSCLGYSELCSEHSKQGKMIGEPSTGYYLEGPAYSKGLGLAHDGTHVWDDLDTDLSILLMKMSLFMDHQLLAGVMVNESFYAGVAGDGFMTYKGEPQTWFGWHAVHVVSFVENDDLPTIAPKAPPGDGGGYFIVRNSWGPCFGDGGYLYIPYSWWTKKHVAEVYAMNPEHLLPLY